MVTLSSAWSNLLLYAVTFVLFHKLISLSFKMWQFCLFFPDWCNKKPIQCLFYCQGCVLAHKPSTFSFFKEQIHCEAPSNCFLDLWAKFILHCYSCFFIFGEDVSILGGRMWTRLIVFASSDDECGWTQTSEHKIWLKSSVILPESPLFMNTSL